MIQPRRQFCVEGGNVSSIDLLREAAFVRDAIEVDDGANAVWEHLGKLVHHSAALAVP
jgi:hypothetical protein